MAAFCRRRLLLLLLLRRRRSRLRKRTWVRKINIKRREKGEYHALIQEMRLSDQDTCSFYKYFRMSPQRFDHLLGIVGPSLTRQHTNFRSPISPGERLAVTLRFLATGDSMQTIAFSYRLGHSTVCNIIKDTCDALWCVLAPEYLRTPSCADDWKLIMLQTVGHSTVCNIIKDTCDALWCVLAPEYLRTPSCADDWKKISEGFYRQWNFPNCIGAIDGKHVVMQAPPSAGSMYYNYKQTHSIVLMAVCDAQYCFTLVDIGDNGRHSDGGVLSHSNFGQAMESGSLSIPEPANLPGTTTTLPYIFLGDAAFPLKTYMLRPYPGRFLEEDRHVFNYCLSQARRVIENTFGILTTKFRIFRRPIIAHPEKVTQITKAACALHNYLKITDLRTYSSSRQYCLPPRVRRS